MTAHADLRTALALWDGTNTGRPDLSALTAEQVLRLCRAIRAGEWDVFPDQLTTWQVRDALRGKPPLFGEGTHDPKRYPRPRRQYRAVFWTHERPVDYIEEPLVSGTLREAKREAQAILRNKLPSGWYVRQIVRVA